MNSSKNFLYLVQDWISIGVWGSLKGAKKSLRIFYCQHSNIPIPVDLFTGILSNAFSATFTYNHSQPL